MDFPIENGGSFHSYVSLPEGTIFTFWYFVGGWTDEHSICGPKKVIEGSVMFPSFRHVSPGDLCVSPVESWEFPRRSATSDVRCAVWSATAPSSTRSLAPWRPASTWRSSRGSKGCQRADCTSTCCGDAMEWGGGYNMHVFAMVCAFSCFFCRLNNFQFLEFQELISEAI